MSNQLQLFFVNSSGSSGKVCVYQAESNATVHQGNVEVLAWLLAGANQSTVIKFSWTTDYNFAWFDNESPRSSQIIPASLNKANLVRLSKNQYGYYFQPPSKSTEANLSIQSDSTIPAVNNAVVGQPPRL